LCWLRRRDARLRIQELARITDPFAGMVNVQRLRAVGKLARRRVPNPFRAVAERVDRAGVFDAQVRRQRTQSFLENVDGFERHRGGTCRHVGQHSGIPFVGSGWLRFWPFREGTNLEVTPAFQRVDFAGVHLKFDVAGCLGEVGADRLGHLPIQHRRRCGFDVLPQCFRGNANPEEFVEGTATASKGFPSNAGGGETDHTWAEKAIEADKVIDVIAVELAVRAGEEASLQGDMAGTGQGVFGVRAFILASVST